MSIIFLYLGVFALFLISLRFDKRESKTLLNREFCTGVRTLFIFLIVLSHILNSHSYTGFLSYPLSLFRNALGQMVVVPFFLFSGFGIFEGYKKKGNSYWKSILFNHFLKIIVFTFVCLIPFFIYDSIINGFHPFGHYVLSLVGLANLGNQDWFIFAILCCYLFSIIPGLLGIKNNTVKFIIISIGCIIYYILSLLFGRETYTFNTIICFPLGCLTSLLFGKISPLFAKPKNSVMVLIASSLLFASISFAYFKFGSAIQHTSAILRCLFFSTLIISLSSIFTCKRNISFWFGVNSWPLFVLHMFPILIFQNLELNDSVYYVVAFVGSLIITIPFGILFSFTNKTLVIRIYRKTQSTVAKKYSSFFEKKLKKRFNGSNPTIFCNTCIGGYIYHRLGLEFTSPTINLWFSSDDMVRFLASPNSYFSADLKCIGTENGHPVCELNDIVLHFNHYDSFASAKDDWERRKQRVNLNNCYAIIVDMSNTLNEKDKRLESLSTKYKNIVVLNTKINSGIFKKIVVKYDDEWHYNFFGIHDWEKQWDFVKFLNKN